MSRTRALSLVLLMLLPATAAAETLAGKQVELIVGSAVGGGYDAYARFLARHMGRFIPGNPAIIVKNMPGAGGRVAANYLAQRAPRDGTSFGIFQNTLTLDQLAETANIQFDMRTFGWVGNMNAQSTLCVMSVHAGLDRPQLMLEREFIVGATNAGSSITVIPYILNALVGTKLKVVKGYTGTNAILLALERKEMNGLCGWGWDSARVQALQLIERKVIQLALDIGNAPHPELKARGVPYVMDMLPDGDAKLALRLLLSPQEYGRPFGAPPGLPPATLAMLRQAFAQTMTDKAFLADAEKAQVEINPTDAEHIAATIRRAFETPKSVQTRAIDVLQKASQ